MNWSCSPLFSLCHPERSLRSEGSRATVRAAVAVPASRSMRRNLTPNPFPEREGEPETGTGTATRCGRCRRDLSGGCFAADSCD